MNGLFPIIRRNRRPLVVADIPAVVVGNVEPVPPVAETPLVEGAEKLEPKASDNDTEN